MQSFCVIYNKRIFLYPIVRNYIAPYLKNKSVKGVFSLIAGNTTAKLIATLGGLILANYYGPEAYGVYSIFLSYIMILALSATFRLEDLLVLLKVPSEIKNLFSGVLVIIIAFIALFLGGTLLFKWQSNLLTGYTYLTLVLIAFGSALLAWNNLQNSFLTQYKLFHQLSLSIVITSVCSVLAQAIFYFIGETTYGLIYGWIIGILIALLYNAQVSRNKIQKIDINLFKKSIQRYPEIIRYTFPSDVLNAIANNILPIITVFYFSTAEIGLYAMATKILVLPLMILSESIAKVFFKKSASISEQPEKLYQITQKVVFLNMGIMFFFLLLMNSVGVKILDLFFQKNWKAIDQYILVLSFWILARSGINPISNIILILRKNHYSLIFNIYLLSCNLIAISLGNLHHSFLLCATVLSLLSGIGYLTLLFLIFKNLKNNIHVTKNNLEG